MKDEQISILQKYKCEPNIALFSQSGTNKELVVKTRKTSDRQEYCAHFIFLVLFTAAYLFFLFWKNKCQWLDWRQCKYCCYTGFNFDTFPLQCKFLQYSNLWYDSIKRGRYEREKGVRRYRTPSALIIKGKCFSISIKINRLNLLMQLSCQKGDDGLAFSFSHRAVTIRI